MEEAANKRQPRGVHSGENSLTGIPAIAVQETSNGSTARYLQCNQSGDVTEAGLGTTSSPITTYLVSVDIDNVKGDWRYSPMYGCSGLITDC